MRKRLHFWERVISPVTTVLAAGLFLIACSPPPVCAQPDEKDAIIKMLKEKLELQQKELDRRQKDFDTLAKTIKASREATDLLIKQIIADYKAARLDLEQLKAKQKEAETARAKKDAELEDAIAQLKVEAAAGELTHKKLQEISKRLGEEVGVLNRVIKDRETAIVSLEANVKKLRVTAQYFESLVTTRQIQNENLLEQLRAALKRIAQLERGEKPDPPPDRDPRPANPPAGKVDGKIERVEGPLVQISVGADHGLKEGNTLEVYRLQPVPKYLGTIRIIDAKSHSSVGRLVDAKSKAELKVGDLVTSTLAK